MNSSPALPALRFPLAGLVTVCLGRYSLQHANAGIAVIQWPTEAAGRGRGLLARSPPISP